MEGCSSLSFLGVGQRGCGKGAAFSPASLRWCVVERVPGLPLGLTAPRGVTSGFSFTPKPSDHRRPCCSWGFGVVMLT